MMFSISELACASSNGSVLIKIEGFGISSEAPFNSARAALARIHCLRIALVSKSTFGGSSGMSLYGLSARHNDLGRMVREDCARFRGAAIARVYVSPLKDRKSVV